MLRDLHCFPNYRLKQRELIEGRQINSLCLFILHKRSRSHSVLVYIEEGIFFKQSTNESTNE